MGLVMLGKVKGEDGQEYLAITVATGKALLDQGVAHQVAGGGLALRVTAPRAKPLPPPETGDRNPHDKVLMELPVVGGGVWNLRESDARGLRDAFPAVHLLTELAKAKAWLRANPSRLKTPRGMSAFVYRWVQRASEGPGANLPLRAPGPRPVVDPEVERKNRERMAEELRKIEESWKHAK